MSEKHFARCVCGKVMPREDLRMEHSGPNGVSYTSFLCKSCLDNYKDAARIVCKACLRLQGFLEPSTAKDGFTYEKGKHYHINGCPQCKPGIYCTPVLEHEAYLAAKKIASSKDLDLIQHIEQKALQGQQEFRRVRSELNQPPNKHS